MKKFTRVVALLTVSLAIACDAQERPNSGTAREAVLQQAIDDLKRSLATGSSNDQRMAAYEVAYDTNIPVNRELLRLVTDLLNSTDKGVQHAGVNALGIRMSDWIAVAPNIELIERRLTTLLTPKELYATSDIVRFPDQPPEKVSVQALLALQALYYETYSTTAYEKWETENLVAAAHGLSTEDSADLRLLAVKLAAALRSHQSEPDGIQILAAALSDHDPAVTEFAVDQIREIAAQSPTNISRLIRLLPLIGALETHAAKTGSLGDAATNALDVIRSQLGALENELNITLKPGAQHQ